jgi:hypothetical protein
MRGAKIPTALLLILTMVSGTGCSTTTYTTAGSPEVDDWLRSHEYKRTTVVLREPAEPHPEGVLLPPDGPNRPIRLAKDNPLFTRPIPFAPLTFAPNDNLLIPMERVSEIKVRERSGFQGLLIGAGLGLLTGIIVGATRKTEDRETAGDVCFECSRGWLMYGYGAGLGLVGMLLGAGIGRLIEHDSVLSLSPAPTPARTPSDD